MCIRDSIPTVKDEGIETLIQRKAYTRGDSSPWSRILAGRHAGHPQAGLVSTAYAQRAGAHGKPVKWCVGPWTKPAGFGERLTRRGFSNWGVRGMGAATDDVLAGQPN